jgi:cell wall assembly regulator SMI1
MSEVPQLSRGAIGSQMRPLGLRLPGEAALWWKWHDGVPSGEPDVMGGSYFRFLTLADSVKEYYASRQVAEQAALTPDEADHLWHPSWFPITNTGSGGVIAWGRQLGTQGRLRCAGCWVVRPDGGNVD